MIRILAGLILSFVAVSAWAQSFDCDVAGTGIERAICADPELAGLDEALADTYRSIRGSLPAEHRENATDMQRLWLRSRNSKCEDHPNGVAGCLKEVYEEWLSYGRSGILFVEIPLESGESHASPLVDDWRFQYDETDFEPVDAQRSFSAELRLYIDDEEHRLELTEGNTIFSGHSYIRSIPNAVGYFLTPSGHIHVGYVHYEGSGGGTCGWYDTREFVFLNRHTHPPQEFHRLTLSHSAACSGFSIGIRTVSATDDGALEFMVPKGGHSYNQYWVDFTEPHVTRIDSGAGVAEEFVRIDTSTTHFEGEPYEDLIARTSEAFTQHDSYRQNAALNDCGVPIRATQNYWWLKQGMIPWTLAQEGRPFGFRQLQHFVLNVAAAEHLEPVRHYKPFVDGVLQYLDGMREIEDWESRLRNAADQYPWDGYSYEMANWTSNPFLDAGFPTDACFNQTQSAWYAVDVEQWIYLFWARRLAEGNLELTEVLMRRISALLN